MKVVHLLPALEQGGVETVVCDLNRALVAAGCESVVISRGGRLVEHFIDNETKNGFTYEIEETIRSIRAGKIESEVCPHAMTLEFARLCDRIFEEAE